MDEARMLFRSKRFMVTEKTLRTPRKTYALDQVDYVQVKRPFLLLSIAVGVLLLAWAMAFWDLLHREEQGCLVLGVIACIAATSRIGTLVVHSLSLRGSNLEEAVIWEISTVRQVRGAVDEAMRRRTDVSSSTLTAKGGSADDRQR